MQNVIAACMTRAAKIVCAAEASERTKEREKKKKKSVRECLTGMDQEHETGSPPVRRVM
jgi:hypothetical protein